MQQLSYNGWLCKVCDKVTITLQRIEGTTPMFLGCRITPDCKGTAVSMMYPKPFPKDLLMNPGVWGEWYVPEAGDPILEVIGMADHVAKGGLALRQIDDENPELSHIYEPPKLVDTPPLTHDQVQAISDAEDATQAAERLGMSLEDFALAMAASVEHFNKMGEEIAQSMKNMGQPPRPSTGPNRMARRLAQGKGPKRARAMMYGNPQVQAAQKKRYPR